MGLDTYLLFAAVMLAVLGKVLVALQAFRVDAVWGFVVLLVPLTAPLFVALYWRETKVPFFIWLSGFAAILTSGLGLTVQVGAIVALIVVTAWFIVREYQETGMVFYGPKNESELDMDGQGRVLDLTSKND